MTSSPNNAAMVSQAQAGVRRSAPVIVGGVAGASTIALLAVSSVMAPALVGGVSLAAVMSWLGGLGGNALAGWLTEWAGANLARFDGQDPERERELIEQLARDLTAQLGASAARVPGPSHRRVTPVQPSQNPPGQNPEREQRQPGKRQPPSPEKENCPTPTPTRRTVNPDPGNPDWYPGKEDWFG